MASSAMAIEAFQERFEWGDLSKRTTLQGRVAVVYPDDKAVWINVAGVWWECGERVLLAKILSRQKR